MMENLEEWALEIGYKAGGLLSTYLGLPLSTPFKSMVASNGVKDRFQKRLDIRKRQYIFKGERLTLIQNPLFSSSIYFVSLFCMPRTIKLRLEWIQRDFPSEGRGSWKKITFTKVSNCFFINNWRRPWVLGVSQHLTKHYFANEVDVMLMKKGGALWKQVISGKYREENGGGHLLKWEMGTRLGYGNP